MSAHKVLLVLLMTLTWCAQPVEQGHAKYYSPNVMKRVAVKRGLTLPDGYAGFASVRECDWQGRHDAMMGRTVWASVAYGPYERYMVADCSHPRDRARHYRDGLVIEVEYDVAARQGWTGKGRARAFILRYE